MARDVCLVNVNLIRCLEHATSSMECVIVWMATMAPFAIKVRIIQIKQKLEFHLFYFNSFSKREYHFEIDLFSGSTINFIVLYCIYLP